jgi:hypothetical protein
MWGEGASDLWGHLEYEEAQAETAFMEAIRARVRADIDPAEDADGEETLAAA